MTQSGSEALEAILAEVADRVCVGPPQATYEAAVAAGMTIFQDDGSYLYWQPIQARFPDGDALVAALRERSPTALVAVVPLLALLDAPAAARFAGALSEITGIDRTPFRDAALSASTDVLWKHASTLPLQTILDYGAKEYLYGTDPKTILALPELRDRAARLEVFQKTLGIPVRAKLCSQLRELIGAELTEARDPDLLRVLIAVWSDPLHIHRQYAATLLWKFGTPETLELLASHLAIETDRYRAIQAILTLRPERSADEIIPLFLTKESLSSPGGIDTAHRCLGALERLMGAERLRADPRWIDAFVGLLGQELKVRYCAKEALSRMDPQALDAGLERAGLAKPAKKKIGKPTPPAKLDFLVRYKAGEHKQVWDELRALEGAVEDEPLKKEAHAVALETMKRLKANLDRIVVILKQGNYKLRDPKKAVSPASSGATKKITALEKILKSNLPISLRAFYETFDSVSLAEDPDGDYTDGSDFESFGQEDPFILVPITTLTADLKQQKSENDAFPAALREPLRAYLSPTWLAKGNIEDDHADDDPLRMPVPNPTMDGVVQTAKSNLFFIDYLRACIESGGFLQIRHKTGKDYTDALRLLVQGFQPF